MTRSNTSRKVLILLLSLIIIFVFTIPCYSQIRVRTEPRIPEIKGYVTLKCDFHMHTVFSDGNVWPPIRAGEAWLQGLDAFAITDHIEYQPHDKDVLKNHNRSFDLASGSARSVNLIQIRGSEITRDMPPGHFNVIFIKDANPLDTEDYRDALKEAFNQGAFIFWNHPPFPNEKRISEWFPEHNEIFENGWMHGIEVVNGKSYYPEAHKWCLEKNLTMMGNSDVHNPINLDYDFNNGEHRPMTLVFAKRRTKDGIKEALFDRRTAVYHGNLLIGKAKYLKPIFYNSIEIKTPEITFRGKSGRSIQIKNNSDISYELTADRENEFISGPKTAVLYPGKTVIFRISSKSENLKGKKNISLSYIVKNLLIEPEKGLPVELKFKAIFIQIIIKNIKIRIQVSRAH
ncbi:Sb-PDE family phosphodiesterase, partial [candidate division KSB1 bacterium]